jgi:hypothetical protein
MLRGAGTDAHNDDDCIHALARLAVLVGAEKILRVCTKGSVCFPSSARRESMLLRMFARAGDMLRGRGGGGQDDGLLG